MTYMPLLGTPLALRMSLLNEPWAQRNHCGQTLQLIASRGGLSPCEALAIIERRAWQEVPIGEALERLSKVKS